MFKGLLFLSAVIFCFSALADELSTALPETNTPTSDAVDTLETKIQTPGSRFRPKGLKFDFKERIETMAPDLAGQDHIFKFKGYAGVAYKFGPSFKLGLRVPYKSQTTGRREDANDPHIDDVYLNAVLYEPVNLAGFESTLLNLRLFLPTGEESRFENSQQGSLYAHTLASRDLGRGFFFNFHTESQIFNNSTGWYSRKGKKPAANVMSTVVEWAEIRYAANDRLAFSQLAGYAHTWYASLPTKLPRAHEALLESVVEAGFTEDIGVILSYRHLANTHEPTHDYMPYRADESIWTVEFRAGL